MQNGIFKLTMFVLLSGCLMFTSCSKEELFSFKGDSDTPILTGPDESFGMTITVNQKSFNTNAYAEECTDTSGTSILIISNNQLLLDTHVDLNDFVDGDFQIQYRMYNGVPVVFGGAVFGPSITGGPYTIVSYDMSAVINIVSNNGTVVDGSISGNFGGIDPNTGQPIPGAYSYSATFLAQHLGQANWCL